MKFIAAIAALAVAAVANAVQPTWTNCATGTTELAINSFSISPYPLCIGQSVCASGTGLLSVPVTSGATLSIQGKYNGRVVYTDNEDLCALTAIQGYPCPIATTVTSITACVTVLPTAPANINVALSVLAMNGDGNVLFCQSANVIASNCST